jgi:hypothetical protein
VLLPVHVIRWPRLCSLLYPLLPLILLCAEAAAERAKNRERAKVRLRLATIGNRLTRKVILDGLFTFILILPFNSLLVLVAQK